MSASAGPLSLAPILRNSGHACSSTAGSLPLDTLHPGARDRMARRRLLVKEGRAFGPDRDETYSAGGRTEKKVRKKKNR